MKTFLLTLVALLALLALTISAQAQQMESTSMELDSVSIESDTAVIRTIEVRSVNDTGNSTEIGVAGEDGEDGKDSASGHDNANAMDEDTATPALYNEGTELDDIGAPVAGVGDVQPDPIGVTETAISIESEEQASGEKGGTEDINIGIGEMQQNASHKDWIEIESSSGKTRMNKAELIDSIAKDSGGVERSGYVKLGDIKGEVFDGAEAKKPKEIVVVGSKVRESDVQQLVQNQDSSTNADSFFDVWTEVSTDEDLQLHAISVAQSNERISEVKLSDEMVRVNFEEKIKLFGIIPVTVEKAVEVKVDAESIDRVKVKFPWWHIFATKDRSVGDTESQIETALSAVGSENTNTEEAPREEVAFYYNKISAQILQTISNISK